MNLDIMTLSSQRESTRGRATKQRAAKAVTPDFSGGECFERFLEENPLAWYHLVEVLPDGIAFVDELGAICHVNERLCDLAGYSREELVGQAVEVLVPMRHRATHVGHRGEFARDPRIREMGANLALTLLCRDGSELAVDVALSPFAFGGKSWVVAVIRDNSAQSALERARSEIAERFRLVFEENMAPMTFTNFDDRSIAVNDAFCQMVGFRREELVGCDSKIFTLPDDVGITEETHRRVISGEVDRARYIKRYLRKDGRVITVEVSRSTARDAAGNILYFVFSERDVTEERALADQLIHQALHEPLTGLANRTLFEDRFSQAHARVLRQGGLGAVLLLDLDNFRGVNDARGHLVGDQLLVAIARRLERVTRSSDTLCRFEGDQFLYLAEGLASAAEAKQMATRLLDALAEPFRFAGENIEQHASIGVVVWDESSVDCTEMIQEADVALDEAKREGERHYVVFTPGMHRQAASRFVLTQELREALGAGELSMYYQPIVDLTTTEVVGFEALMRWRHPERGWVSPNVFIPLAEQSELIVELGSFALREAVEVASGWERVGALTSRPYVTVNFSALQFHNPRLVSMIEEALLASGLEPERLIIEITESVALLDVAETLGVMEHLSRLGIGLALDDFGTGYSSLSYLTLLQPRIIKIDRSFVSPTHESVHNETLLEAIVSLGHKLGMTVLAEGIETQAQFARLRHVGCELGQGYLFSPAVPAIDATAMVGQVLGS